MSLKNLKHYHIKNILLFTWCRRLRLVKSVLSFCHCVLFWYKREDYSMNKIFTNTFNFLIISCQLFVGIIDYDICILFRKYKMSWHVNKIILKNLYFLNSCIHTLTEYIVKINLRLFNESTFIHYLLPQEVITSNWRFASGFL